MVSPNEPFRAFEGRPPARADVSSQPSDPSAAAYGLPREGHELIAGRYEILNQLARGGMGAVFRAVDRLNGRVVTVKRLRVDGASGSTDSADLRTTLAHEFRLVVALRHPNVISVLDYGFDDDRAPFLVMDLEEGARTIVEAGVDSPLAVQVDLLVQTLRAVDYLHRLGVIHCDLKPDNILVVRGQVKVLDFGLSVPRSAAGGAEKRWAGTPAYMAPELILGGRPGEQSDLFAVGMVACELFTGAYPLTGMQPGAVLSAILTTVLPRPQDTLDPRIRPVLERLLAKDVEHRYRSARQVITELGQALGLSLDVETVATRESFLQTASLVGRKKELATLEDALRDALTGRGSTWLVGGESGIGKSRVLDELRTRGLIEGAVVVRGQAVHRGGGPYHPWRDVISTLLLRSDPGDADAEVLATIIPTVGDLLGRVIAPSPTVDSETTQTRLLRAVEQLFRLQPLPLVVILEDLNWAGSESLRLLAWLVQTAEHLPLLLVGSFRDDEAPTLPEAVPGARLLSLPRLARDEIAALGETMIGHAANRADLLDLLERETEGIPFFVVEVVRTLAETSGALDRIGASRLPQRVVSGGMQKVVHRRLARVPSAAFPALRTAAVIGREVDPALMHALYPALDLDDWAIGCARAAVLEMRDQRWMFSHDKLREQLVDQSSIGTRRELHRSVGEAMERVYDGREEHLTALAHHWGEAGDTDREARYACAAGTVSLRTGACREAAALFLRARELLLIGASGTRPTRPRIRGVLDPNTRMDTESSEFALGLVEGGLSEAFYRLGDLKTCRVHSERALRHFGQHVPRGPAGWIGAAIWQGLVRGAQTIARMRARNAAARPVASEIARVQLRLTDTFFYSLDLGGILWSSIRVVNQCEPAGPLPELAQGYAILALLAGAAGTHRLATRWARRALTIAEGTGIPRNVAWIRSRLAVYHVAECRWAECEAGVRHAAEVAERVGDQRLWEEARTQYALLAVYRGRFEESLALFREVQRLSRRSGNQQIACWGTIGEGGALCRLGRDEDGVRILVEALAAIDEQTMRAEAITGFGILALARLRTRDPAGAFEAADRAVGHIRTMKAVAYWTQPGIAGAAEVLLSLLAVGWAPTPAVRARLSTQGREAVLAMRRFARHFPLGRPYAALWSGTAAWIAGRARRAHRLWERAIALAEQLGTPYECARAHLEVGRYLPTDSPDRLHHLHRAEELFDKLGSVRDAAVARAEGG